MDYTADMLDSRDLIERMDEIESAIEDGTAEPEEVDELAMLRGVEEAGIEDWPYGATFIRDSYFKEYAQELAEDIGAIDANAQWPLSYIDWEAAADALKMDYTVVTIDGTDYFVR